MNRTQYAPGDVLRTPDGREMRLMAIMDYVDPAKTRSERRTARMAFLRPVGGGIEITIPLDELTPC